MSLFDDGVRVIVRDSGERVTMADVPLKAAYTDSRCQELSQKYDVHSHIGNIVPSSLGSASTESYAVNLFRAYSFVGEFCGFSRVDLEKLGEQTRNGTHHVGRLEGMEFLVQKAIEGVEVLFPTEAFLKNQRIRKRKSL